MCDNFEWELSKENIRPLSQGRLLTQLSLALSKSGDIENQRRKYEIELRTYFGDDPLTTWCSYLEWASQTYVTGRLDFYLSEKCIKSLCKNEKYHDDNRFVRICYRYAKRCEERLTVFRIIHDMGIGRKEGLFYKSWAECCEGAGKFKEADTVYEIGLELSINNRKELQDCYKIFLENLAHNIKAGIDSEVNDTETSDIACPKRMALGLLSISKKNNTAPILRVPSKGVPGKLFGTMAKKEPDNHLLVFHEDFENGICFIKEINELRHQHFLSSNVFLPENPTKSKENVKIPLKWSNFKVAQQMSHANESSLEIYEDKSCSDAYKPGIIAVGNSILRSHQSNVGFKSVFTMRTENEEIFICPMQMIYMGSEEFSIEELMALHKLVKNQNGESPLSQGVTHKRNKAMKDMLIQRSLMFWTNDETIHLDSNSMQSHGIHLGKKGN